MSNIKESALLPNFESQYIWNKKNIITSFKKPMNEKSPKFVKVLILIFAIFKILWGGGVEVINPLKLE